MTVKFFPFLLIGWMAGLSVLCGADIRIPYSSKGLIEKVLRQHPESDAFEALRQSGSIASLAARDPANFENPKGLLHAALILAEQGQWIAALEFCQSGADQSNALADDFRKLSARIYASHGEMARAHNTLALSNGQAEGPTSRYWFGAYIQFNERIQRSLYEMRIENKTLMFPESLLAGDRRILEEAADGPFWQDRFELCRSLKLEEDAALAAAWIAWYGLENQRQAVGFLNARHEEATQALPALRSLVENGKTDEAIGQILFILQRAPVSHSMLKSLYDLSVKSDDKALAVSILGMRWQAGEDRIDMPSALPLVLQQGDFALLLSMASAYAADPEADWEAPYYLALAARAWNLPSLEARAMRALADIGFKDGIYRMPIVAKLLFEEKSPSFLAKEHQNLATINPLADALSWRLRELKSKNENETIFPKEQLANLAEAAPADLPHVAFLLSLIDRERYEAECSLQMEKEIAAGILSLLDPSAKPDYNAVFVQEYANGILKALLHCRLVRENKRVPSAIRSTDPVFWTAERPTESQIKRIRSGATLVAELSEGLKASELWPAPSGSPLRLVQDPRFIPVMISHDTDLEGPVLRKALAKVQVEALVERFLARDRGKSPKEQHEAILRLTYSIAHPPEYEDEAKAAGMFEQQMTTMADAIKRLETSNRQLEATMLANEYLFSGVFTTDVYPYNDRDKAGKFLSQVSAQTRKSIKAYAEGVVSRYWSNDRDSDATEEMITSTARSLYPPESPYFAKALAMVRAGTSVSAIHQEINRQKAEAALRRQAQAEATRRSEQRMREYWAEQDTQRNTFGYQMTQQQAWSMACQAYIRQSSRRPEVIKNYNANGTITIITRY